MQTKTIKALSVHQPWAQYIADRLKTIETRTWQTHFRGDLLICSTKKACRNRPKSFRELNYGKALAIVELYKCQPMIKRDEELAMCPWEKGRWSWFFINIRKIEKPFPVVGRQGLFNYQLPKGVKL